MDPIKEAPAQAVDAAPCCTGHRGRRGEMTDRDQKTGWPPPELMQDDCRELSLWFATRLDAWHVLRAAIRGRAEK